MEERQQSQSWPLHETAQVLVSRMIYSQWHLRLDPDYVPIEQENKLRKASEFQDNLHAGAEMHLGYSDSLKASRLV